MDGSVNAINSANYSSTKSTVDTVGLVKQHSVNVSVQVYSLTLKIELDTGTDNFVVGFKVLKQFGLLLLYKWPTLTAYGNF